MGIVNFIIVLFFNILWMTDGADQYFALYNGRMNVGLSVIVWIYAAWGIFNLYWFFKELHEDE